MQTFEQIAERLNRHPELTYHVTDRTIAVDAPTSNGFAVSLTKGMDGWVVAFDGWHEHFKSEEEALNCFVFGLSDRCRLQVCYRGSFPYRWTLEEQADDSWREVSTTGLLFFPFWRRPRVEYRQNDVIGAAEQSGGADQPCE